VLSLFRSYDGYRNALLASLEEGQKDDDDGHPRDDEIDHSTSSISLDLIAAVDRALPAELTEIKDRFSRYVKEKFRNKLRLDFVHGTAQWQSCFQTLTWLNRLLLSPWNDPDPALLYNGTLASTLAADLRARSDWRKFVVEELFRGSKRIGLVVLELVDGIVGISGRLDEEVEAVTDGESEKRREKMAKKKKREVRTTEAVEEDLGSAAEVEEEEEELWIDRNNKFSRLSSLSQC